MEHDRSLHAGGHTCPKGHPDDRHDPDDPADVSYAVQWEQQHHFTIEFLLQRRASARFAVDGVDALLVATSRWPGFLLGQPHLHARIHGLSADFSVVPWNA